MLEVELLPGDDALLAPPWVPWTERLAEWRRQHPDEAHPGEAAADDESDDDVETDDDEGDLDEDDLAVDDALDELDETELDGVESPEGAEQDSGDIQEGCRTRTRRLRTTTDEDDQPERRATPRARATSAL